jgi:phage terminase large subunit GpA-like protein
VALIKTGERREWRKKPHQPNEALDIVVGARALAWGEGAGQITGSEWRELAAKAHGAGETPKLFSAPLAADLVSKTANVDAAQGRKMTWGEAVDKLRGESHG